MKELVFSILFLSFLFSCSSGSEDPVPPENVSGDTDAPSISIGSFPDSIEVLSNFQVSVTDASDVSTEIFIDDELILTTSNKAISFDIDPFDYTVGSKTLRIVSTDANNNEETYTATFELNRLLFVLPNPISDNAFPQQDLFLTINLSDGSLYSYKKIENDEDGTLYADDDFERQNFTVSLYRSTNTTSVNFHNIYSFADIEPATTILSASERFDFFNPGNLPLSIPLLLDLGELNNPRVAGYNGRLSSSGGGFFTLNYATTAPQRYFLYDFPDFGATQTDYSYAILTDLQKTTYTMADLSMPVDFITVNLPDQSVFGLVIEGYESESDYNENKFNQIFQVNEQTISTNTVDIPLFPGLFETYNLSYNTILDNKRKINVKQRSLGSPINIDPISVTESGPNILIDGSHDYSRLVFRYGFTAPNTFSNTFEWTFHNNESTSIPYPLESFEIPQEILNLFAERSILPRPSEQTNDFYILDLEVYDHSETVIYENMMFGSSYNQNEGGDVTWLTYNLKN